MDSILDEIKRLDPQRDHQRIAFLSACYAFPWDTQRALELAILRSFAVESSAKLLEATGEFTLRTQKRYDDTSLIISTIGFYGYDSPEGRAAIRRMNQIHGRYRIPNDEYLYVLSTFVYEPIRWNARFGWRALHEHEKLAGFYFWTEVGRRMNIKDIPATYETFEAYNKEYEAKHFTYNHSSARLANVTAELFLGWVLPEWLWPFGRQLMYALLDAPLRRAFGFPEARLWARVLLRAVLRGRAGVLAWLPARQQPYVLTKTRTYPQGFRMEEIGPH